MADDVFGIVGTTLAAAFHVEAVVAEGGFAVVYRAYHSGFRAPVALKCLKIPQHLGHTERRKFEQQFQAEAELLFKLSASIPTVVRPLHVEAIVTADGTFMPFIALEWLEGETLDAVATRRVRAGKGAFSLDELTTLLTPVARALERAHRFVGPEGPISIVHRDMKPENVFLARIGGETVVKILDFGIGKAKSVASQVAGRASQNDVGVTSFTPAYGAPEQWTPRRYGQTGPWTDVWGLALTMVECMAGRPIIDGDQAAMMGTALDPARRPTPRTEGIVVGDAVEGVFRRALAVDPRERYTNAGEFWDALVAAHDSDRSRKTQPQPTISGNRAAGRSGAHPFRTPELGRQNPIPDLDVGAAALEFDLPVKPSPSRSGQWPAAPVAARRSDLDGASDSAPIEIELAEKPATAQSGQWHAAPASSGTPRSPVPAGPPGASSRSGQWQASTAEPLHSSVPPSGGRAPAATSDAPQSAPRSGAPSAAATAPLVHSQRPLPPAGRVPLVPMLDAAPSPSQEMLRRFALPAGMVIVGILTTIGNGAYAAANGEVFTLGPIRLAWLAAALVIGGIVLAIYRLLFSD
ncbi:MAG TPA: protein kinase [Polyangiaceae bacterium]|nr:protein kinase [Polyangiaceae bacterium]